MPVVADSLWKNPGNPGMIVVAGHAYIEADGRLFLGYGQAQEAVRRIPDIEKQCAQLVRQASEDGIYGFLPVRPSRPKDRIVGFGLLQTRLHYNEPADLDLIAYSLDRLRRFSEENENLKIRMDFPGLEAGLPPEQVEPLLVYLPPSVTICHHGQLTRREPVSFPGFKTIYLRAESMILDGHFPQAVEYLVQQGFDLQTATEQAGAIQRILRSRVH
jgi:hypothetical protein